jgi:hypothetical protein
MNSDAIRDFLDYLREELLSRKWEEASFPRITGITRNDRSDLSVI